MASKYATASKSNTPGKNDKITPGSKFSFKGSGRSKAYAGAVNSASKQGATFGQAHAAGLAADKAAKDGGGS